MRWLWGLSAFLILTTTSPARAEEGESRAIQKGRYSLAFSLPDGGGAQFGVWKMVSGRSNLGVNLGIDHQFQEETWGPDSARSSSGTQFWTFSLEPSIKRYLFLRDRVSPFLTAGLEGSYGWVAAGGLKEYNRKATLLAGIGADWTPLRDVSIGASTGITWTEGISAENDASATKRRISVFGTQTGSLTLHLYF
jgi:hypothetical protein